MKRFIYVTSQKSETLHRLDGAAPLRGKTTACGLPLTTDWRWFKPAEERKSKPMCCNCERVD